MDNRIKNKESGSYIIVQDTLISENDFKGDIKKHITIDLNIVDLQLSRVSLPDEEGLWDFEDCDFETTKIVLSDLNIISNTNTYKLENSSINYAVYKDKGEYIFKVEEHNFNLSFNDFKEHILEKATWNDQEMLESEFKPIFNEDLKFTEKKLLEISENHRKHKVLMMHNNEDRKAFSTQVQDLTNNKLSYGDFESDNGFLLNKANTLIIVLPEKHLEELALFEKVKSEFGFKKVNFQIKESESEINYLVRENNQVGLIALNNKAYKVFKQNPSATGDATTVILLKSDEPPVLKYKELSSDYGIKQGEMRLEGTTLTTEFNVRNGRDFTIKTDTKDDSIFIPNNQNSYEDAVDSVYFSTEPNNRDKVVEQALKDVIKANYTRDIQQAAINVKRRNKVKPSKLRI